jgi:hypothetical protein
MDLRLTFDELQVLLRLVRDEVVSREFAAEWARERREKVRQRRLSCWPPGDAGQIRELLEAVATADRSQWPSGWPISVVEVVGDMARTG